MFNCESSSFARLQEHHNHTGAGHNTVRISSTYLLHLPLNLFNKVSGDWAANVMFVIGNRTFSSLPRLRPSILSSNGAVFRPCNSGNTLLSRLPPTAASASPTGITSAHEGVVDVVPRTSITAHPALAGPQQIRCGPRPTMARSSRLIRKRRHGFLSRIRTRNGQRTLQRRKDKKRSVMSM
ncbi:hypothetical protein F5Y10DRAFT_267169 [Nemania abortiva]|nr:hypothetical protein F5Y10DRAFT_267169 [Nemania abortiva]